MAHIHPTRRANLPLACLLFFSLVAGIAPAEPEVPDESGDVAPTRETAVKVVLPRDRSGNYMGDGEINGHDVRFLVDTGASMVVVPEAIAKRIGLRKGKAMPFRTGGGIVNHYATELESLSIGRIQISDAPAAINPEMRDEFVLLGMSALGLLKFSQDGDNLVLSYDPGPAAPPVPAAADVKFQRPLTECMGKGNVIDDKALACLKGRN